MEFTVTDGKYRIDTKQGTTISIPLRAGNQNPNAFYAKHPTINAVITDEFTGDTLIGGLCNFKDVSFNPHGNGTHTECVGHIAKERIDLADCLKEHHFLAQLITIEPESTNEDLVITKGLLEAQIFEDNIQSVIIRTLPNEADKMTRNWSGSNPPYIHHEAVSYLVEMGIDHLLLDLPSVDRESDEGQLLAHKAFWNYPSENVRKHATITEMIYVPKSVKDGLYILNIQVMPIALDASASNIVVYPIL